MSDVTVANVRVATPEPPVAPSWGRCWEPLMHWGPARWAGLWVFGLGTLLFMGAWGFILPDAAYYAAAGLMSGWIALRILPFTWPALFYGVWFVAGWEYSASVNGEFYDTTHDYMRDLAFSWVVWGLVAYAATWLFYPLCYRVSAHTQGWKGFFRWLAVTLLAGGVVALALGYTLDGWIAIGVGLVVLAFVAKGFWKAWETTGPFYVAPPPPPDPAPAPAPAPAPPPAAP